jgi:hypothetical protein
MLRQLLFLKFIFGVGGQALLLAFVVTHNGTVSSIYSKQSTSNIKQTFWMTNLKFANLVIRIVYGVNTDIFINLFFLLDCVVLFPRDCNWK